MPYAMHRGVRIHYQVEGSGRPLVLQHGFTQSLRRWYMHGYVDALNKEYQLILIDARGHGLSDKPHDPNSYTLSERTGDVLAVLDDLNIYSAAFWGYSMGGRIGFGLAKYAPGRVTALVIGGQHPYERHIPQASRLDGSDPEAFLRALADRLKLNVEPAAIPAAIREELLANDFRALAAAQQDEPSLEDVLPSMTMPSLFYAGDSDPAHDKAKKCVTLIRNARFMTMHGQDHGSAFREAGTILPMARTFLREANSGSD